MKKIKLFFMLCLFGMISVEASAENIPNNEIWYTSIDGEIIEPYASEVFGTSIVSNQYKDGKGVITFKGDVTSIGENAFYLCSGLTTIEIPNSTVSIGSYAFSGCSSLTSIEIPNSVTSIGSDTFWGCYFQTGNFVNNSSLNAELNGYWGATIVDIKTGDGLCIKDNCVVRFCGNGPSVTIPNFVTSIGEDAFYGCKGLTTVTIPNSVTSIGNYAFAGCNYEV